MSLSALLILCDAFVYVASTCCSFYTVVLSADESSLMLLKRECWHVAPQWVNVSLFKDSVDGAALDEHRQPFLSKRAPP